MTAVPPIVLRFAPLALGLAALGFAAPAAAQGTGWVQCVARSGASGTLYVGEPTDGAVRAKAAQYRAEFIKAGRAAGAAPADLGPDTAFCFMAPSQADLAQMVADLGKAGPGAAAAWRQAPVAWNIRDILPAELAASASHLTTLVISEPPAAPALIPASAPGAGDAAPTDAAAPAPPPPPHPIASARWRALLCGADVRLAYAFEAPTDGTVESAPFRGSVQSTGGITATFDEVLDKTAAAAPTCASTKFVKVATLADFARDLPPRGDARLAAIRQRLEDTTVQLAPPPPPPAPPPQVAAAAPAKGAKAPPKAAPVVAAAAKPAVQPPPAVLTPAVARSSAIPTPIPAAQTAAPPVARAAPAAPPPAPSDAAQTQASAQLNGEIARRNAEIDARNAAAAADYEKRMAAYKAAQDSYAAAQADYQRNAKQHELDAAKAAEAHAAWEAKVKACTAGDRAACATP